MIAALLALALVGAPTSTVTVARAELVELCGPRLRYGEGRPVLLGPCIEYVGDLEATHAGDLADIRTLTSTASPSSPALEACTLGGLLLGAAGGACAGVTDATAQTACTVVGVVTAAAGAACSIARLLSD